MPLHRFRLALDGPLGTPLTSGTLFGHLCWARLRLAGEAALTAWLAALRDGASRFLLSDAFPADLLPRPLLPPFRQGAAAGAKGADEAKERKKFSWVTRADWLAHRGALSSARLHGLLTDWRPVRAVHAHNRIDRITGTTPETQGLWFVEDDWSYAASPERDLYVDTDLPTTEVEGLLAEVGAHGYGRDATYGRGRFRVLGHEPDPQLADHPGNRLVSLSHGCLGEGMAEARWERFTHFGKVAIELAHTGARPFKRPVLLMKPGATFRPVGAGPFGALLSDVHQDCEHVVHHAFHLAIPYTEVTA
jgi:CRISPR-associated protein Csm4